MLSYDPIPHIAKKRANNNLNVFNSIEINILKTLHNRPIFALQEVKVCKIFQDLPRFRIAGKI
jgi:hypothetical protein